MVILNSGVIKMEKLKESYRKAIKSIITITLYFIWPTVLKFILKLFGIETNEIFSFISNIILLIIIMLIYFKDLKCSLNKMPFKKMLYLFVSLVIVQILTNLISITILGVNDHRTYGGIMPSSLEKWPLLVGLSLVIVYPILETLVFNKSLKDVINNKWAFIFSSSLFFWLVNLYAFDFKQSSIIATMSCFTTSIVINYFYYKEDNISSIIVVKMIYNLIFLCLP